MHFSTLTSASASAPCGAGCDGGSVPRAGGSATLAAGAVPRSVLRALTKLDLSFGRSWRGRRRACGYLAADAAWRGVRCAAQSRGRSDRKSTRLNSSHMSISYAVFCLKKKTKKKNNKKTKKI